MSYRKVALLMLFPSLIELAFSCCDCVDPILGNYTNKSLQIYALDNAGAEAVIVYGGNVSRNAFGIRVRIRRDLACDRSETPGFTSSAIASDCGCEPQNQLFPVDSITAIKVITLNDFDESHPADSDVTDYFKVYQPYTFQTIDAYLSPGNTSDLVVYDNEELDELFDLLLMTPPPDSGVHQFKVQITVSDGRIWEAITEEITLI